MNNKLLKILYILLIFLSFSFTTNYVFATGTTTQSSSNAGDMKPIKVKVTEKVPGANCVASGSVYICEITPGMTSLQTIISNLIKYFTAIATIAGVLFIVINGIMLSMGGLDSGAKDEAKKRVIKTIGGLILLLLSGLILSIIAPWIYK